MQEFHQVSDGVWSSLTKLLMALTGGNILVAAAAFMELVPAIASLVSLMFLIWVGVLTVRERNLSIKIKNMTVDDMERQRQVDHSEG
ncbi:hypothetical protein [Methylophaga sp. OBS4]|uniref:hypothetical protein n=1 Tax=Methylophaga sp. OBS4 TaxID=2991935 RepID=UPI0022543023|nr:hypothetical protein [Methylophaga sp. OBS4]MCX4186757.1 hypothetical protein [Methylophaga sp. OBS4]